MISLTHALAAVGIVTLTTVTPRLLRFIWIYCLRPSSIQRYIYGDAPYALITGASDGIGAAVARELYGKGFNLILHGRNADKVRKLAETIQAGGSQDVQYFITDAKNPDIDFAQTVAPFAGLNITLVVNNVGGGDTIKASRIDATDEEYLLSIVHLNALFPLRLTRVLLPQLRALSGPALVIFIGSQAADAGIPRLPLYSASKAFLAALAQGLSADEHYWERTNVSFMHAVVGEVSTNSLKKPSTLTRPSATRFAKALVARVGCGQVRIAPWMPHAIIQWLLGFAGEETKEGMTASIIMDIMPADEKKLL